MSTMTHTPVSPVTETQHPHWCDRDRCQAVEEGVEHTTRMSRLHTVDTDFGAILKRFDEGVHPDDQEIFLELITTDAVSDSDALCTILRVDQIPAVANWLMGLYYKGMSECYGE